VPQPDVVMLGLTYVIKVIYCSPSTFRWKKKQTTNQEQEQKQKKKSQKTSIQDKNKAEVNI